MTGVMRMPVPSIAGLDDFMGRGSPHARHRPAGTTALTHLTARFDWYHHMRVHEPVSYDPQNNCWGIFRYADVRQALTNVEDFTSNIQGLPDDHPLVDSLLRMDPPRHRHLRGLVNQAFSARRIASMRTQIQTLCTALLDAAVDGGADGGRIDVAGQIAQRLPTLVITDLLGIDPVLRVEFARWTSAFMRSLVVASDADGHAALAEMEEYFRGIIAQRHRTPGPDLISTAVGAEVEGARLSDRDLLQFCKLLLIAGSETTTHSITNSVLCLQQDPVLLKQAREDPSILPAVVEEALRYLTPVQAAPRAAARDVRLHGQLIPAGAMIYPWTGSANRDPDVFSDADVFRPDRTDGKSLAFGHGIHFCVGAALARLETEVVLGTLLTRLPGRWVAPEVVTVFPAAEMCGLASLPLQWP